MIDSLRRGAGNLLSGFYSGDSISRADQVRLASIAGTAAKPAELYNLLRSYYNSNGLYQGLARGLYEAGIASPAIRALRNPCLSVVEFYVATVIPGSLSEALAIEADNERIVAPVEQVWQWSNFGTQKAVLIRWVAMLGDVFVKTVVPERRDRVYHQLVDPAYVTDFSEDERGFLTYARIDVPITRRTREATRALVNTEVWSRDEGTVRRWEHDKGDRPVEELGTPLEEIPLSTWGIDFIPITQIRFRDVGEPRGIGAYTLQLDAIDELQRIVTRLHQQLYRSNNATWVVESAGRDASGRPLPALAVGTDGATTGPRVVVGDETMYSLPGGYTLTSLVPQIDYRAALDVMLAHEKGLQHALPEMVWAEIAEVASGDVSGRALRYKLTAAVARAMEVRANVHEGIKRAAWMALTMGSAAGLFRNLGGTFESGAFEMSFASPDIIPLSDLEQYQAEVQRATAAKLRRDLGISKRQSLRELDYQDSEIDEFEQQAEADQGALNDALGSILDRQPGAVAPIAPGQPAPNGNGAPAPPNTGGRNG